MAPIRYGFPRGYGRYIIDIRNGLPVLCIRGIPVWELGLYFPYDLAVGLADVLCQKNRSIKWRFDKYKERGFLHSQLSRYRNIEMHNTRSM